jgi:hypothetical protein
MADRTPALLAEIAAALNRLPGVFSTAQWGGRAYKLPGPGGNRSKPKLVAHVAPTRDGEAVSVSFKLPPERAADVIEKHEWIEPHEFRTLAPAGWVNARISTKRQLRPLGDLLAESRALHPETPDADEPDVEIRTTVRSTGASAAARRIDRVMENAKKDGWTPPPDDGFDN